MDKTKLCLIMAAATIQEIDANQPANILDLGNGQGHGHGHVHFPNKVGKNPSYIILIINF